MRAPSILATAAWLLFAAFTADRAVALGFERFGPRAQDAGTSPDWPKGIVEVLSHPSRVYWRDVNGSQTAYYDGGVDRINELLKRYAAADLTEHPVIIRAGSPTAKSFHGREMPYVVEFDVPGGVVLHHLREYASTGLVPSTPRMFIHIDAALAERLDEIKIPDNCTVKSTDIPVETALAYVDDEDRYLRFRAIEALGESADASAEVAAALERAAADEDKSIRSAAERALAALAASQDPANDDLRQRVAEYVDNHARRASVPAADELLAALRRVDAEYAKGFTARGTRSEPSASGRAKLVAWTITFGLDRLVVEERDVVDADHPVREGCTENTIYVDPKRMATIHGNQLWLDGKLIDARPVVSFEPAGSTYDLLIGRVLWPLGRGYSRQIERITGVAKRPDGLLNVDAESGEGRLTKRWELVVDPKAAYLIRDARAYARDEQRPAYAVTTAGELAGGERTVVHTARWTVGVAGQPRSISVTHVSHVPDVQLIRRTEGRVDELPGIGE